MLEWVHYGPNAVLLRFADRVGEEAFNRGRALTAALEEHPPPGLTEFVPAFTTLLLEFDPHLWPELELGMPELVAKLERATEKPRPVSAPKEIEIVYDGPDLERVAKSSGLTVAEVKRLHATPIYKVYCLGFTPGFPYLGDLDARLHTPRLASPRTRVPRGSVGIGGEHTGIYSVESPGGWNIIGHTDVQLFDPERRGSHGELEGMFFLRQGDQVKFVTRE
jgi:KipI family sensor histidine kinase inhibitor